MGKHERGSHKFRIPDQQVVNAKYRIGLVADEIELMIELIPAN
jgi:hypothetical protein